MSNLELVPVIELYDRTLSFRPKIKNQIVVRNEVFAVLEDVIQSCLLELSKMITGEEEYIAPVPSGFLLKQNEQILVWPRCCSDFSQIDSWEAAINIKSSEMRLIYIGHPSIKVMDCNNKLEFYEEDSMVHLFSFKREELLPAIFAAQKRLKNCEDDLYSKLKKENNSLKRSSVRALFGWIDV